MLIMSKKEHIINDLYQKLQHTKRQTWEGVLLKASQLWKQEEYGNDYRPWVAGKVYLIIMIYRTYIIMLRINN